MTDSLKNWIPYRLNFTDNEWKVAWLDLGDHYINEPFFDETIDICKAEMLNRSQFRSQTDLSFLLANSDNRSGLLPTAFIFHVSRCGSTLLSQILSVDRNNIVIPEAPILDEVLKMREQDPSLSVDDLKNYFIAMVKIMGQKRSGTEQNYFIKLDSWHLHYYQWLRAWFPTTPFYFISREPRAIIASHHKKRGMHCIPGYIKPALFKIELTQLHFEDFDLYTAEVLSGYYKLLKQYASLNFAHNHFHDYTWGIAEMLTQFSKVIGLPIAHPEMINRTGFHSKFPDVPFRPDPNPAFAFRYEIAEAAYMEFYQILNPSILPMKAQ